MCAKNATVIDMETNEIFQPKNLNISSSFVPLPFACKLSVFVMRKSVEIRLY